MEFILRRIHKTGIFGWLYVMALLHAFHFFAVHFIDSSLLEQYRNQTQVGFMYAATAALSLIVLATSVVFLEKIGAYYTAIIATTLNCAASFGLAYTSDTGWIFVLYVLHAILMPVTLFCFDVFLENYTRDESTTGSMRGLFLTMSIIASLLSPLISGWLVGEDSVYEKAYLISALYLVPTIIILISHFKSFTDPVYEVLSVGGMFRALRDNKNIFYISTGQFLLRFFFSWMVVYMPIYLHQYVGFSWIEIGIILFIMLMPYLIIEYPAGIIADKWLGEKELLIAGFVITSISTASLFFIHSENLVVWSVALLLTRVGAALIESMTETYFFKQINGDDASILSIFRMLRPLAYTVGPFTGGVLLISLSMKLLWPILGGIMLLGVWGSLKLVDTR
jgi:MFS family permease